MEGAFLAVARFRKPHGLKGEAIVWVLTDTPERVLAVGERVTPLDDEGSPLGQPLTIERSRRYHRHWLLKFREVADRTELERWGNVVFGAPRDRLEGPAEGEAYEHELPGMTVRSAGKPIGSVTGLLDVQAGKLLAIDVNGREVLVPFRRTIVRQIDRVGRVVDIEPPAGLLEL